MRKLHISMAACLMAGLMSTTSFAGVVGHGAVFATVSPSAGQNTVQNTQQAALNARGADALGKWNADAKGWWWRNPDNSWAFNTWAWLDGNHDGTSECYYFGSDGYMLSNAATPDGYTVDENGAWVKDGIVQTKKASVPSTVKNTITKTSSDDDDDNEDADDKYESYADKVISLVNKERKKKGRSTLEKDDSLTEAAEVRAEEITEKFSHTRPDGSSCFTALDEAGVDPDIKAGENLAKGQATPKSVMKSWMNSSGHKKNILEKDFNHIGVGAVKDGGTWYWVQEFSE